MELLSLYNFGRTFGFLISPVTAHPTSLGWAGTLTRTEEQFTKEGGANLEGAITSAATSITARPGQHPLLRHVSGTHRRRDLKASPVSGWTWTVVRADGGSTAASHADNATVTLIVTKER